MMSAKRYRQIISGQTTAALKVYDAVPISEHWTASRILGELMRTGANPNPVGVSGCLESLRNSGLVKENRDGFCRVPVRPSSRQPKLDLSDLKEALEEAQPQPPQEEKPMPITPDTNDAVEILSRLSQQIAATAARHLQEMSDLASLVSDAAIEVQAEREAGAEDLKKYRQLKALLA